MKDIITDLEQLSTPSEKIILMEDGKLLTEEASEIIGELKEVMESNKDIIALGAPQIGINKRIFGIRFNDVLKFFVNPIITKKSKASLSVETLINLQGKEILLSRPEEISAVYYNEEFKYEDNKFIGPAAKIFDQQVQLLDGVLPTELGLVSDIETDGRIADLSEDEFKEVVEIYKKFIAIKSKALEASITENEEEAKAYKSLKFTENVITGKAAVVRESTAKEKYNYSKAKKAESKASLNNFLRRK